MIDPKYLILTKASSEKDVCAWGVPLGGAGLAVAEDGSIQVISQWTDLPQFACRILVLNMALEYLEVEMEDHRDQMDIIVGQSPRVWVHFGNINSDEMTADRLVNNWLDPAYNGFRRFVGESHPMPYSQTRPAEFDQYVQDLSGKIRIALAGRVSGNLDDPNRILRALDAAWEKASARFSAKVVSNEAAVQQRRKAGEAFMPIFVYLDGLLYADGSKDQSKIDGMEKLIRADVKGVLADILPPVRQASPQAIQDLISQLETGTGDLHEMADRFCREYRQFIENVMSEATTKESEELRRQ